MSDAVPASFRDPSGFLFVHDGVLLRQVNSCYQSDYDALLGGGLYDELAAAGMLIPHQELLLPGLTQDAYKVLRPERLSVVSYPYEWSFSQLQDAALLTLDIQLKCLQKGLSLKDASAYNVQFHNGRPIFIDTLSFERYPEDRPWVAYRQFCQHFLAPLALMAKTDISLNQLLRCNIDGIPLQLASKLLPLSSRFSFGLGIHIHMHAKSQVKNADKAIVRKAGQKPFSKKAFVALLEHLRSVVGDLRWQPKGTEWFDYYDKNHNYMEDAWTAKAEIVEDFLRRHPAKLAWDLGANTGRFSQIAARHCAQVCAWDIDPACVELHYRAIKKHQQRQVLPLLLDLTNPSPAIGWDNKERLSLKERMPVDMVLALGLVHHLAISNNVPLRHIAQFFIAATRHLIIEFIPKDDSQVIKLLRNREDIFPDYNEEHLERVFSEFFVIEAKRPIPGSKRTLYLMSKS